MAHHPVFKLAPGHLEIDKCLVHLFARSLSKQVLTYQEEACCQPSGIHLDPIALGKARIFGGNSIHQGVEIANGPIDRATTAGSSGPTSSPVERGTISRRDLKSRFQVADLLLDRSP